MSSLGAVSIVASGSDSNGRWVRWADGTQICWSVDLFGDSNVASGSLFRSTENPWTLPGPGFINTSYVVTAAVVGNTNTHWGCGRADTTTLAQFTVWASASFTGRPLRLMAVGRWF